MTVFLAETAGWVGAGCLVVAYALLASGRLPPGARYHLLNLAGALGLAVNGIAHRAWPSAALNLLWLAIGVVALGKAARGGYPSSLNRDRSPQPRRRTNSTTA